MTISIQAIFCDDVRREVSGKDIIIGVYGVDLIPVTLPIDLSISLWLRVVGLPVGKNVLRLTISNQEKEDLVSLETAGETYISDLPHIFSFLLLPVAIRSEGYITASLKVNDELYEAGRLKISYPSAKSMAEMNTNIHPA